MHPTVLKADPLSPSSDLTCSIDMGALRTMDTEQLAALGDAMRTIGNVVAGLYCQPRFCSYADEADQLAPDDNAAGKAMCALNEWLCGYEQAIINVLEARTPRGNKEVAQRARALLAFEASCDDDLGAFSKIVTEALATLAGPEALQ